MCGMNNKMQCHIQVQSIDQVFLLLVTGLFHLFILILLGFGISSDPFPCSCLGPLLTCSISYPDFDV